MVISLLLISAHFTEARSGPLHAIQRVTATVLSPLEGVASAALKPGRDFVNWFDETFDARGDVDELRTENEELRAQLAEAQTAVGENEQFRALLDLGESEALAGYASVTGRVIARSPSTWFQTVTVNAGSGDGVEIDDPVVAGAGLVGRITEVTSGTAQVQLITDHRNAVSARVLPEGPQGIVEPVAGEPDDLTLDFVDNDQEIEEGQILVTAGWNDGRIASTYPYGIEIGEVTETTLGEEDFQRITVEPYVDMRDLQYVQMLTGGPERPEVTG